MQRYNRLLSHRPILTKTVTAAFLGVGGDALAQLIERRGDDGRRRVTGEDSGEHRGGGQSGEGWRAVACEEPWRGWYDSERGIAFSSLATFWNGPFMHYYFDMIRKVVPQPGVGGLLRKVALTQIGAQARLKPAPLKPAPY